jgi:4-amino-4-deoxy-L-arabinose transferase-like glycosyltransferase
MANVPCPAEDGGSADPPFVGRQVQDILASLHRKLVAGEISESRYEKARAAVLNASAWSTLSAHGTAPDGQRPDQAEPLTGRHLPTAESTLRRSSLASQRPLLEVRPSPTSSDELEFLPPEGAQPVPVAALLRGVFELEGTLATSSDALTNGLVQLSLLRSQGRISQSQFDHRRRQLMTRLPAIGDREAARADISHDAIAELALRRAWGHISGEDFRDGRTLLLGRGLDQQQQPQAAPYDDVRVSVSGVSTPEVNEGEPPAAEGDIVTLSLRHAWGQISHEEFVSQRSASLARMLPLPLPDAGSHPPREHVAVGSVVPKWLTRLAAVSRLDRRASAWLAVQVALFSGVGLVQGTNMLHWPAVNPDEGTYVADAWAVQTHGALGFYTYTYGHPPLAWVLMSLWTWATSLLGSPIYSVDGERGFMLVVSLTSTWLVYLLARRLGMRQGFAVVAVLLFTLSPIDIYYHRLVLLDNPATAWALAAFVLALTPRRRLWAVAASGACFAAAVLCKETLLLILPALLVAAVQNTSRQTRRYSLTLLVACFIVPLMVYPLYAALKGELLPGPGHVSLLGSIIYQLHGRRGTGSILNPNSISNQTVRLVWLRIDPWLLGGALVLSPLALFRRSTRAASVAFLIQVVMLLRPGYLPNMYVIAMLPFAALLIAGSADALWPQVLRSWKFVTHYHGSSGNANQGSWRTLRTRISLAVAPALAASLLLASGAAAQDWVRGDSQALSVQADAPQREAESWLVEHVRHDQRVIVGGDVYWIYLIEHGFDSHPVKGGFYSRTVVSYWPLDYDPAVQRYFPQGWRDFDYIVSTFDLRITDIYTPNSAAALLHSRVVATFGSGNDRIEIRAITKPSSR